MSPTKILAIGREAPMTAEQQKLRFKEAPAALRLYLDGKIEQWWNRQDQAGVVFVVNATSIEEAQHILDGLPLHMAKVLSFDFIPMGPLKQLQVLLG
jgi:hypothetical protein